MRLRIYCAISEALIMVLPMTIYQIKLQFILNTLIPKWFRHHAYMLRYEHFNDTGVPLQKLQNRLFYEGFATFGSCSVRLYSNHIRFIMSKVLYFCTRIHVYVNTNVLNVRSHLFNLEIKKNNS